MDEESNNLQGDLTPVTMDPEQDLNLNPNDMSTEDLNGDLNGSDSSEDSDLMGNQDEGSVCSNYHSNGNGGNTNNQIRHCEDNGISAKEEQPFYPIVLKRVRGFDERRNDVIYYPPDKSVPKSPGSTTVDGIEYGDIGPGVEKVIVFYGGDIQDLQANMTKFLEYSLEATATLLHSQLPGHHILIIRPSMFKHETYSSFDNFVPSPNNTGNPEHTANHNALKHLEALLRVVGERVSSGAPDEEGGVSSTTGTAINLVGGRLSIVGFSKGCVVLNQFLYEFHFYKTLHPESPPAFLNQIAHMFWLDGGHSGGKNTWITARPILDTLTRLDISVHVHMTPYQLNDDRRPYIRNEEKVFSLILPRLGLEIDRKVWFEGDDGRIETHFALLGKVFEQKI